jgi:hypothetical protein
MRRFVSRPQLLIWLGVAGALVAGCSFQEFDYLQDGGTIPSRGGSASAGSSTTEGGTKPDGQSGAGEPSGAGTAGTSAGKGGGAGSTHHPDAGDTGNPGEGGAAGAGGAGGADGSGATGATGELVNPSFETFNTVGWTVKPSGTYAFVQAPQGTDKNPDGAYEFSTWSQNESFTVELYQNIKGLEDGKYTFKGYFSAGLNNVSIFARNCGGAADPTPVAVPAQTWTAVEVKDIEVVGGSCEVGVHVESMATQWMNADLFTFEKDAE